MSSNLRPLELEIVNKMFPFHISTGNVTPSALSGRHLSVSAQRTLQSQQTMYVLFIIVPLLVNLENIS